VLNDAHCGCLEATPTVLHVERGTVRPREVVTLFPTEAQNPLLQFVLELRSSYFPDLQVVAKQSTPLKIFGVLSAMVDNVIMKFLQIY